MAFAKEISKAETVSVCVYTCTAMPCSDKRTVPVTERSTIEEAYLAGENVGAV